MSGDDLSKAIFIILGWFLSTATTLLAKWLDRRRHERRVFSRLGTLLESVLIHLEVAPHWRDAGLIETVEGILGIDESWRYRLPPSPPLMDQDFETIERAVSEWEGERGKNDLTRQIEHIKYLVGFSQSLYAGLSVHAKDSESIPERALNAYTQTMADLKKAIERLLNAIHSYRITTLRRLGSWIMHTERTP